MITTKQVREKVKVLDELINAYNKDTNKKKRDWRTYEERVANRLKHAIRYFERYIDQALTNIIFTKQKGPGAPEKLTLKQRVMLLLIKQLMDKSNRDMSIMMALFSVMTSIDISYKTIERLYDDQRIIMILNNVHILIINEKKIEKPKVCGDATGYVLSVKENYCSISQKIKDKKSTKKRKVIFSFALMDIDTRLYLAYGTSYKSESKAYEEAIRMLKKSDIIFESIRLDRYYSKQCYVREINEISPKSKIYLIPKKNVTVKGNVAWKEMLIDFVHNTMNYFKEYYQRNQSESGFAEDKKRFGWRIRQKLEHRINLAYFGIFTWHNLMWIGAE